ncbi:unnamed protein product [Ilex paraguariensis]|uniref:Fe2OG dioxygenase domain-containing protein n=1 Tax=Ilex paraguariensis TaxID=185542 RepID=A0ABC8TMX0_9AQUA
MAESTLESYPPLFRQTSNTNLGVDSDEPTKQVPDSDPLPVIDLQCINQAKLSEACRDWGMFRLVNHGIPTTLLSRLHEHARKLFSFTFESKQALFTRPMAYSWGTPALTPSGEVIEKGLNLNVQNLNWMEGFFAPLGQLSQLQTQDPMLDYFRLLLEEYGIHQFRLATTIFEAMAEDLKLCLKQSKSYLSPTTGMLRAYRYPRCPEALDQACGLDVHTDSSVLSILNQDEGGLQIYKDGDWIDVKPIPNTLVINLGDMMQAISNDKYLSAKHRVKVNKHKERISICYFVFPEEDTVIKSSKYKPFTYADFRAEVQQDLKTVGFKVGLQRFRLTKAC